MTLKEGINVEKLYSLMKSDEYLFGNKRIILIEQLSCEKNKKIRAQISNEKFIALVTDAAKKYQKEQKNQRTGLFLVLPLQMLSII